LFEESRAFIASLPFTYLHVFTYSARPGTPATEMPDQVPVQVARERNKILRDLAAEKNLAFRRSFVGKTVEAITLHRFDAKQTEALTDNFLKMQLEGKHDANQWVQARIKSISDDGLLGSAQLGPPPLY
jgi:threonylcarbamoyladenosine tRNA methylthiotransferase MtaB